MGSSSSTPGPLFIHQLSHIWIDFRSIRDAAMREHGLRLLREQPPGDPRPAALRHAQPEEFAGYGEWCWGITACEGPGPATLDVDGVGRRFFDYVARGVPRGPDDGTLAPWAVIASLPFAPEIVAADDRHFAVAGRRAGPVRIRGHLQPDVPDGAQKPCGWVSPCNFGLNDGPILLMIENHRTGLLWELMRRCPYLVRGLRRAGFRGGWLEKRKLVGSRRKKITR